MLRIREVFARLGDQEGEVSEHPKVSVCGSALASWMWLRLEVGGWRVGSG